METDDINRRKFMVPTKNELGQAVISFSKSKKEWGLFLFLVGILFLSTILILQKINLSFMIKIPGSGGEIVEGIIGTPRFANPILSPAGADKDLTTLIYSGLMKKNSDNKLETDLLNFSNIERIYTSSKEELNKFSQEQKNRIGQGA